MLLGLLAVALLETSDSTAGVENLLLTGVEGVAVGAHVHEHVIALAGSAGHEGVAARARHLNRVIIRMNTLLHLRLLWNSGDPGRRTPMAGVNRNRWEYTRHTGPHAMFSALPSTAPAFRNRFEEWPLAQRPSVDGWDLGDDKADEQTKHNRPGLHISPGDEQTDEGDGDDKAHHLRRLGLLSGGPIRFHWDESKECAAGQACHRQRDANDDFDGEGIHGQSP